jgi:sugar/nucleoside kinase (ribokinase family)
MVTAARLGVRSRIVAVVGDDPTGRRIREGLDAEGVDTSAVRTRAGCRSAESIVLVEPTTGRRTILWNRGSGAPLKTGEIPPGLVEGALALLVDGHHPDAQCSAVERASRAGVPVVLDAGSLRSATRRLLPLVDHAIVSQGFARDWSGSDHGAALLAIRDAGPGAAVITLGERGCVGSAGDGVIALPALPAECADTNGAGDVFHGAYLAGLARGLAFPDRLRLANAAAGLQCRAPGPRAGIPGLNEALAAAGLAGH